MSKSTDLNSMGLKATFPRLKILELFENAEVRHLTADDVYRLLLNENIEIGLMTRARGAATREKVLTLFPRLRERRQKKIAKERGFAIQEHALYLYAECTKVACQHRDTREKSRHQ